MSSARRICSVFPMSSRTAGTTARPAAASKASFRRRGRVPPRPTPRHLDSGAFSPEEEDVPPSSRLQAADLGARLRQELGEPGVLLLIDAQQVVEIVAIGFQLGVSIKKDALLHLGGLAVEGDELELLISSSRAGRRWSVKLCATMICLSVAFSSVYSCSFWRTATSRRCR